MAHTAKPQLKSHKAILLCAGHRDNSFVLFMLREMIDDNIHIGVIGELSKGRGSSSDDDVNRTITSLSADESTERFPRLNTLMSYFNPYGLIFSRRRINEANTEQSVPLLSDNYNESILSDLESSKTTPASSDHSGNDEKVANNKSSQHPNDVIIDEALGEDSLSSSSSQPRWTSLSRVIKLVGRQSFYLYIGCIVLVIRLPFSLSIPHFVSAALGAMGRADFSLARYNIILLLIMGTIDAILDFWCVVLFGLTSLNIVKCLRVDLFSAILKQEMAFFDSSKSPELASRLSSDCGAVGADLSWFFRFS